MTDLDNFFAKKDKKKVKGRKYDNPDEIAKRLKESEKRLEKDLCKIEPLKKSLDEVLSTSNTTPDAGDESVNQEPKSEKVQPVPGISSGYNSREATTNRKAEEEEWKDFTDESQKDMTNLKISKLQIEDDEDGLGGYGSGEDDGGSGGGNKMDGVWNKKLERYEKEAAIIEAEIIEQPSVKEDSKSTIGGSYVPPHLRNASSSQAPRGSGGSRKPKTAPDITNAMAFPSLSDSQTATPAGAWGRKKYSDDRGFESVKHGSTRSYPEAYSSPRLSTTNRFDALSDHS